MLVSAIALLICRRLLRQREVLGLRARESERLAFLGTLASGLAHEIRNPLSALNINLQLLEEQWRHPVTEREQHGYRKILMLVKEVHKIEQIFNDFLRFAKEHKLNLEKTQVNNLIEEALQTLDTQVRKDRILTVKQFADDPWIYLDPDLMRQALINILRNSYQAMPNGGKLTVQTRREKDRLIIRISDTGAGIPQEIQDKVFTMFFSTKKGGTGLGLSTSKKIVEAHGGKIGFESRPGGTTFEISLPVRG